MKKIEEKLKEIKAIIGKESDVDEKKKLIRGLISFGEDLMEDHIDTYEYDDSYEVDYDDSYYDSY